MPTDPSRNEPLVLCATCDDALARAARAALDGDVACEVAASASAARERCEAVRPDLILLDAQLEGALGWIESARFLAPVVAVGEPAACVDALARGAADWIDPRAGTRLFAHRVRAVLRGARTERELQEARHGGARAGAAPGQAKEASRTETSYGIRPATEARTAERARLETALQTALERGELSLHYQPRVDLTNGTVRGLEALMRWKHPELGSVSPAQFIPVAEETGLIIPIGEWALREACRQNREWRTAGLPRVRVAVNLSTVQFQEQELEARVARALEETGLEPDGLELELTESMLLTDAGATIETLEALNAIGVRLAIDDFGTGYSSLSYIKRFPVDALKVDRSFVREVTTSPEDAAITTSIVLMGKSLGLEVVAEGVETRSQVEFLRVLECEEAQGYYFSRPVPAADAAQILRAGYRELLVPRGRETAAARS